MFVYLKIPFNQCEALQHSKSDCFIYCFQLRISPHQTIAPREVFHAGYKVVFKLNHQVLVKWQNFK